MGKRRGGAGGGGGRGGRGEGGGGYEDQYGGFGSQDRDSFQNFSQKSSTGGGAGGSQSRHKAGHDLSFQRHVPKFLQKYSHLLGKAPKPNNEDGADEDAPVIVGGPGGSGRPGKFDGWDEEEDDGPGGHDDDVEEDALRRAMADNPQLAKEFEGTLEAKLNKARAAQEKEAGNRAFGEKKYAAAISHFTKCIELDPECEVYWSNRSAAHAALEQWEAALTDARKAVQLKPKWAKAYSRLGVAFFGLKLYGDAKEAYERALKLEPEDASLRKGLEKAELLEMQHMRERKHTFFSKKAKLGDGTSSGVPGTAAGPADARAGKHKGDSEGEEEEEEKEEKEGGGGGGGGGAGGRHGSGTGGRLLPGPGGGSKGGTGGVGASGSKGSRVEAAGKGTGAAAGAVGEGTRGGGLKAAAASKPKLSFAEEEEDG